MVKRGGDARHPDTSGKPTNPNPATVEGSKALVDEIIDEIMKDSVKRDALAKLEKGKWYTPFSKFFQHPAVLLIIGFAFTGIIGAALTNSLQSKEWEREQIRTLDLRGYEQKYEIIDEITKAVWERNAAAMALITPIGQRVTSNKQLASSQWRIESSILELKLATRIKREDAAAIFGRIRDTEGEIGKDVNSLQDKLSHTDFMNSSPDEKKNRAKQIDGILNNIHTTDGYLKQLVTIIADEARDAVKHSNP